MPHWTVRTEAEDRPARGGRRASQVGARNALSIVFTSLVLVTSLAPPALADTSLYIIHLNDTHGRTQSHHFARQAALVESLREAYGRENCLLVHSGDVLSKGNMFTAKTKGQGEVAYLNELGLDVWTLGNGDLYGLGDYSYYDRFPLGRENARRMVASFHGNVLSGNYLSADRTGPAIAGTTAYCVREVTAHDGRALKVGLVGLSEIYSTQLAGQGSVHVGRDHAWYIKDAVNQLISVEHVDLVIPVTHLGYYADPKTRDGVSYLPSVEARIIRDVAGFPALLGGHDHIPRIASVARDGGPLLPDEHFNHDPVQYGNSGYGMGDGEKEWWSPAGYPLGVLKLVLDDNGAVKSVEYTLEQLPDFDPTDPVQAHFETFLTTWIDEHAEEYADPYYGPLTYSDLDTPWPAVWPDAEGSGPEPAPSPTVDPIYIRGETRSISDYQWVAIGQDVFVGEAAEVNVVGPAGRWDLSDSGLYVGDEGRATLRIFGGDSYVAAGRCAIGGWETSADPGATEGTVLVSGGWLNVVDWLDVGSYGRGSLYVTHGGQVSSGVAFVGFTAGSEGVAEVGAGSYWNSGDLLVGHRGTGTVRIVQGGVLQSGVAVLGGQTGSAGTVLIQGVGSTWYVGDPYRLPWSPLDLDVGPLGNAAIGLSDGGQLYVVHDMQLSAASQLNVQISDTTPWRSISVGGTAELAGQLNLNVVRPTLSNYLILEADSLLDDSLSVTITEQLLLVDYSLVSNPQQLVLRGQLSPDHRLFDFASTPNAFALANSLDRSLSRKLSNSTTPDGVLVTAADTYDEGEPLGGLLSNLVAETDPYRLGQAVNALVPETAPLPAHACLEGAFWFGQIATEQLQSRRNLGFATPSLVASPYTSLDDLLASAETDTYQFTSARRAGSAATEQTEHTLHDSLGSDVIVRGQEPSGDDWLWGTTYGAYREQESRFGQPDYRYWSTGFLVGAEADSDDQAAVGLLTAYDYSHLSAATGGGDMNTFRFGLYSTWQDDDAHFANAIVSAGLHWSELERTTAYGQVDSNPLNTDVSMTVNVGRDFCLGRSVFTPEAGLVYTYLLGDAHAESNAAAGAMQLDMNSIHSLRSLLGASLTHPVNTGSRPVVAELQGGWLHAYLDEGTRFQATFLDYHDTFLLSFGSPDRDSAYFGMGLVSPLSDMAVISIKYLGLAGEHNQSHTGLLHLGVFY